MHYSAIKTYDIANGTGVRTSLFVSGCRHHCKGCFNPETWDFSHGKPFTQETIDEILESLQPSHIEGLTLLGGEPLEPENQKGLLPLLTAVKEHYPDKSIWCFSGYTYERDILAQDGCVHTEDTDTFLSYIDILVDGEFIEEQKDITLKFRGSKNQRMIDVKTGAII